MNLPILESFFDKPFIAGYSLASIFQYWWVGLIIIIVAAVALVGAYFLLNWLFGRMKFKEGDKEALKAYDEAPRAEKKEAAKAAQGPVKNVITWKRMRGWLIPVVCVVALLSSAAASFLPSNAFQNLLTTLKGSAVAIVDTPTSKEAAAQAEKNVVSIQEEGTVLLKNKNNALPINLETNKKVNIFGSCAFGLFYGNGGSGSFQTDGRVKSFPRTALKLEQAMKDEGFEINENIFNMIKNYYSSNKKTISVAPSTYDIQCGFNKYNYSEIVSSKAPYDYEPPVSAYETPFDELGGKTLLEDALAFSDTAIFCITRRGSEDEDMNLRDLQLKANEIAAIDMLEENFKKVIILLNVPTVIESEFLDDSEISAAVYMGHPGLTGTKAVAEILAGKVNPSGHLVDTWPYDVKSAPSYHNFGNDTTLTYTSGAANRAKFTNYQEGIYVGYRYYVTAAKAGYIDYEDEVQFSFGHGLSYTTFDKSIAEFKVDEENQKVEVTVEVKNTGAVAGKDVIQLYTHAPYTPGGIEKSYYSLTAFQKTNVIEPGETKAYKLEFSFRDIASWSTAKGYYVLEKGEYEFSIRENVWDLAKTEVKGRENAKIFDLKNEVEFKKSYQTGKEYANIFQDVEFGGTDTKNVYVSRNDFKGTIQKTADINRASSADASHFPGGASNQTGGSTFKFTDNQIEGTLREQGKNNGLKFNDFKDAAWDDPRWEDLIDQMSIKDLQDIVDQGSFKTAKIDSIGKAGTTDYDGPGAAFHSGTGHPSEVVVACSWDLETAKVMGESIGREGASRGLTGWYAPGLNIHRSPFGGRNFEYYSEDPFLSGILAASISKGTWSKGCYTTLKHFAANETETHRMGLLTWLDEQNLRENYLKGFEIAVKGGNSDLNNHEYFGEDKATKPVSVMTSFNRIGERWTGGDYRVNTLILREEWGFEGFTICDFNTNEFMVEKDMFYSGGDLNLQGAGNVWNPDFSNPNDVEIMKQCSKNILYVVANSNAVRGEFKVHLPRWQVGLYIGTGVVAAGLATWGFFVFFKMFRRKKEVNAA